MQELIKIEKRVIGAEETNAVEATELHKRLDIKKAFSHWIKTQINRAGLRENVDYVTIQVASDGGRPFKEYIITTDASKHIAMMSQGHKAKEVRDYFIAVEKEFKSSQNRQDSSSFDKIMLVLQQMLTMLSMMLENQNKQAQKQIANALTPAQLDTIKLAVNKAAKPLAQLHSFTWGEAVRYVYQELNGRMGVFSYYQISPNDYKESLELLEKMKIQKELELEGKEQTKLIDIKVEVRL